jgi:ethylbenzene dehydrogenase
MKPRTVSILAGFLAILGAAGWQSETGQAVAEQPAPASVNRRAAEAVTTTESGKPGLAIKATSADGPRDYAPLKRVPQEIRLTAYPTTVTPVIDGRADDAVWKAAPAITTLDYSSQRPITLKSVVTATDIFFLVTYPKAKPADTHMTWIWDPKEHMYRQGPDREDVFVFKWSMSGNDLELKLRDPEPHRADIWYWKGHRTNPSGYADDKWQSVSTEPGRDAKKLRSAGPNPLYLRRVGDAGLAAFDEKFFYEYKGDRLEKYVPQQPQGSRADVRAKGRWANGQWTIEFARKLDTKHDDDQAFAPGGTYLFGVSTYEMAAGTPNADWSQPLYKTGDVFDRLLLTMPRSAGK